MKTFFDLAKSGKPAYGIYVGDTGECVAEMAAFAGFDYMRMDCEHTLSGSDTLRNLMRIADAAGIPTLVRISTLNDITKLLDFGAKGILAPNIHTAQQAKEVVKWCKYHPMGERGIANIARCYKFGATPTTEYLSKANSQVCVALNIESVQGVNEIDRILEVEGVDIIAVGALDLSQSMGHPGQTSHPDVVSAQNMIIEKTVAKGLIPLITAGTAEQSKALAQKGVYLQTICFDTPFIMKQFQSLISSFSG